MATSAYALLLAGLLAGSLQSVSAQGSPGVPSLGTSAQQAAGMASANIANVRLTTGNARPAATTRSYAYVPTEQLRRKTVSRAVANAQATNPAGARIVADFFGSGKHPYQPYYDAARRSTSLPDNDAAAAMAVYLLAGYLIINNYRADPTTPAMAQGVRNQLLPLLAGSARFATPAALAQTGEDMKLQTVLLTAGWQQSLKAGTSEAFRRSTAAYFADHFNRDFTQLKLSSQGFVRK